MNKVLAPYKGEFRVSQEYKGEYHKGIDLVGISSKNLYSTVNGVVEIASNADPNGFGIYIRIKADDTGWLYYYGHMSSVNVKVGQHVAVGTLIGVEGSTGKSTGSHCHYEVRTIPGNKNSFVDINELSGITNTIGTYTSNLFPSESTQSSGISSTTSNIIYRVQAGSFSKKENATSYKNELINKGYKDTFICSANVNGNMVYRVQVGAFSVKSNADNMLNKIKNDGYSNAFILTSTK